MINALLWPIKIDIRYFVSKFVYLYQNHGEQISFDFQFDTNDVDPKLLRHKRTVLRPFSFLKQQVAIL